MASATVILGEIGRSLQVAQANHALWKSTVGALKALTNWKRHHRHWQDAARVASLPFLPRVNSLRAIAYLDPRDRFIPDSIVRNLQRLELLWYIDNMEPPAFWTGANLDDEEWRLENGMARGAESRSPVNCDVSKLFRIQRIVLDNDLVPRNINKDIQLRHDDHDETGSEYSPGSIESNEDGPNDNDFEMGSYSRPDQSLASRREEDSNTRSRRRDRSPVNDDAVSERVKRVGSARTEKPQGTISSNEDDQIIADTCNSDKYLQAQADFWKIVVKGSEELSRLESEITQEEKAKLREREMELETQRWAVAASFDRKITKIRAKAQKRDDEFEKAKWAERAATEARIEERIRKMRLEKNKETMNEIAETQMRFGRQ
ncbi:hypothetical protein VTG60DRAFT_3857 [Thermothelomyces hinnuleus]